MAPKLEYKHMYYFRYNNPVTIKTIHIFDKAPVIIPLDIKSRTMLAINIHWLHPAVRQEFIDLIMDLFDRKYMTSKGLKFSVARVFYMQIKKVKRLQWAMKAIRRYRIDRITNLTEIPQEQWDDILQTKRYRARFARRSRGFKI